eukprot:6489254-Prymnesium_polylepis.1
MDAVRAQRPLLAQIPGFGSWGGSTNKQTNNPPKGHADERTRDRVTDRQETNEDKRRRPPTRKNDTRQKAESQSAPQDA